MATDKFGGSEWLSEELKRLYSPKYSSCAVITDATRADNPILYATSGFMQITGYDRDFITGRNCRFLQGDDTCAETVARIRHAVENARSIKVNILNYRKDGRRLNNNMHVKPIFDDAGQLRLFCGYLTFTPID